MSFRNKRGFTLIEILVATGILMVFASLVLVSVNAIRHRARSAEARRELAQIVTAWEAYYGDYGYFPVDGEGSSISIEDSGEAMVQILRGQSDNSAYDNKNPRDIPYMDFHIRTTQYLDPWDQLYQIALDENYDGEVDSPEGGTVRKSVIAWTYDQNRDGELIKSWR